MILRANGRSAKAIIPSERNGMTTSRPSRRCCRAARRNMRRGSWSFQSQVVPQPDGVQIIADTLEDMHLQMPKPTVDLDEIAALPSNG